MSTDITVKLVSQPNKNTYSSTLFDRAIRLFWLIVLKHFNVAIALSVYKMNSNHHDVHVYYDLEEVAQSQAVNEATRLSIRHLRKGDLTLTGF